MDIIIKKVFNRFLRINNKFSKIISNNKILFLQINRIINNPYNNPNNNKCNNLNNNLKIFRTTIPHTIKIKETRITRISHKLKTSSIRLNNSPINLNLVNNKIKIPINNKMFNSHFNNKTNINLINNRTNNSNNKALIKFNKVNKQIINVIKIK